MPTKLPSRLRRLDDALADLPGDEEPMLLTELDGFLAGVAVCPELIMPSEWLPRVWSEGGAPFENAADAKQFAAVVTAHYNEVLRHLNIGRFQPLFEVDERNGEVLWELWMGGFEEAMLMRPDSWALVNESNDADAAMALAGLMLLADIARDESGLTADLVNDLSDEAPNVIPAWVTVLHRWRFAQHGTGAPEERAAKAGRNDACACGSGKKYKRCCGLN